MKIGFLDSGIGGLSVLHNAIKQLPEEQFMFYADKKHVPYGEKTREEIMQYTTEAVDFLINKGAKAIVIACNTATSVAVNELRSKYKIPIIGMEPAVKKAIDIDGRHRIFVTATPITVKGDKMKCLIEKVDKNHHVDLIPLPQLVRFAEKGEFESKAVGDYLANEFSVYNLQDYTSLVLGCTHFNYFKDSFRKVLPKHIVFVDGIEGTVKQLIRKLTENDLLEHNKQSIEYYYSGEEVTNKDELEHITELMKRLDFVKEIC